MISLDIIKVGEDKYHFSLKDGIGAVHCFHVDTISNDTQGMINEALRSAAESLNISGSAQDYSYFKFLGKLLHDLLPEEIQEGLQRHPNTPLLIQTNDPSFPWELLHDDRNFIKLTRPVGRTLMVPLNIGQRFGDFKDRLAVLIIANPNRNHPPLNLPEAENEAKALLELFKTHHCQVKILAGHRATKIEVMKHLHSEGEFGPYDIIHFSGHAEFDESKEEQGGALILHGGQKLLASEIRKFVRGFPVVFLNACHTSQAAADRLDAAQQYLQVGPRIARNLAEAFLIGNHKGGARALIGTLWRIADLSSRKFAEIFYDRLLGQVTIGEALCHARRITYDDKDATWASFILYGDPSLQPFQAGVTTAEQAKARKSPKRTTPEGGVHPPEGIGVGQEISLENFGNSGKEVLYYTLQEMEAMRLSAMITAQLFIGLTKISGGYTQKLLEGQGFQPKQVRDCIRSYWSKVDFLKGESGISARLARIFHLAQDYAELGDNGSNLIEEKQLLQGFLEEGGGSTRQILESLGVQLPPADRALIQSLEIFQDLRSSTAAQPPSSDGTPHDLVQWFHSYCQHLGDSGLPVMEAAFKEWFYWRHGILGTPHLFIGLTKWEGGVTCAVLKKLGLSPKLVRDTFRVTMGMGNAPPNQPLKLTKRFREILGRAHDLARQESSKAGEVLGTESLPVKIEERHLLLGFLQDGINDPESPSLQILKQFGLDASRMWELAQTPAGGPTGGEGVQPNPSQAKATPLLDRLGRDLSRLAKEGKLTPVVGREKEIERLIQVLSRKAKNNAVLIGEAGVGKTAIVEGLAQWIAQGKAPPDLANLHLVEISAAGLVAGTKYRGDFEERLQQLVTEVRESENVVVFVDEMHTLMGAGESMNGALDAANILKPALARGEIRCIGATTVAEYRKYVEADAALDRRFQSIMVNPPTPEDALAMLKGAKSSFESHHGVIFTDAALEAAVQLSVQYLPDRHLPDKAFDLIDEAAARVKIARTRKPSDEGAREKELPEVTPRDVAEALSCWKQVSIPLGGVQDDEREVLLGLEDRLQALVVGQNEAVAALAQAVRLTRVNVKDPQRPAGVFLLMGPVGVGKSYLARTLAEILRRKLIQLDMSEFSEPHQITKLIGAPPAYVGHGEEGILTGPLRTYPNAVVLLDEIEKAHPKVLDLFLSLFEEGRLTDGKGRAIDARNAMFIMTSNLDAGGGSSGMASIGFKGSPSEQNQEALAETVQRRLGREFTSRIDRIVRCNFLEREHARAIARLMVAELTKRIWESHGLEVEVGESVYEHLCDKGYAKVYGVRPLRQKINELIGDRLSQMLLAGDLPKRGKIVLQIRGGEIALQ